MPTLRIKYRAFDGFDRSFRAQADHFTALHPDVNIELESVMPEVLYEQMVAQNGAQKGECDIMLTLTDWLPELMKRDGMVRLNDYLESDPPEGWSHAWSESMRRLQTDAQGNIFGMAYHDGPEMFHYRTDLFESAREQAAFEKQYNYPLRVPETWDQFLDIAKFFTRPDDGLWGCVVGGKNDGHNNVYDFLIHLWSRGGQLLDSRLRPAFDSEQGREALQFYVDLLTRHNVTPPETLEWDSVLSGVQYADGKGAMMWNWCGFMAVAQLPPSKIINKTRCTILPRGSGSGGRHMSLNIYWVLIICAGSQQKDLAWQFLKETASPEMDKITSLSGGTGTRLSTWNDPEVRAQFQYYEQIEAVHRNVESPPPIPEYPALNQVLSEMSWSAVQGTKTVPRAIQEAAQACQAILASNGYYQ